MNENLTSGAGPETVGSNRQKIQSQGEVAPSDIQKEREKGRMTVEEMLENPREAIWIDFDTTKENEREDLKNFIRAIYERGMKLTERGDWDFRKPDWPVDGAYGNRGVIFREGDHLTIDLEEVNGPHLSEKNYQSRLTISPDYKFKRIHYVIDFPYPTDSFIGKMISLRERINNAPNRWAEENAHEDIQNAFKRAIYVNPFIGCRTSEDELVTHGPIREMLVVADEYNKWVKKGKPKGKVKK